MPLWKRRRSLLSLNLVRLLVTSRRQQQLKKALSARINLLAAEYQSLAVCLNSEYVRSEAFASHFLQALRAVEVAEQRKKVEFIAAAVLGCAIQPSETPINRQMCLRIIEQAAFEELEYLFVILSDDRFTRLPQGIKQTGDLVETEANTLMLMVRGLAQLGLFSEGGSTWGGSQTFRPTILAEYIVLLCQATDLFSNYAV